MGAAITEVRVAMASPKVELHHSKSFQNTGHGRAWHPPMSSCQGGNIVHYPVVAVTCINRCNPSCPA
eukprot:7003771-Ditylum_brightwellii.AAC.1